jgi:GntR family transcriptional repressor for pyruvate dehydrogenase complex
VSKKPINHDEPRADEALRRIVGMIFDGRLSPGARLPAERELALQLGVSRTTLRDAMSRLRARGYVESKSKSGNYVCTAIPQAVSQPIEDVVEAQLLSFAHIIEIREVLELWGAEQAARSPTRKGLAALRASLKTMQQTSALRNEQQLARYSDADLAFHQAIAEMTSNPLYVHLIHFIGHLIRRSISLTRDLVADDFAAQNLAAHQSVYDAIRRGDVSGARAAMEAHFQFVKRHLRPPATKSSR